MISAPGEASNTIVDRLVELPADVRSQERDVPTHRDGAHTRRRPPGEEHPSNFGLILQMHDDPEHRDTYKRLIERQIAAIRRLLDDLRDLGKPPRWRAITCLPARSPRQAF